MPDKDRFQFSDWLKQDKKLQQAADVAAIQSLGLKHGERVLIVTNPSQQVFPIAEAMYDAAERAGARPVLMCQPVKQQLDFADEAVYAAMQSEPDVVISLTKEKLGKDRKGIKTPYTAENGTQYDSYFHYLLHGRRAVRGFWSPGITLPLFAETVPIDYNQLKQDCGRVQGYLEKAVSISITSPAGTDLKLGAAGREPFVDDGNFAHPGLGGNLPAGEVFLSPQLGTAEGIIVFDGSMNLNIGDVVFDQPVNVGIDGGFVSEIGGGPGADILRKTIEAAEKNAEEFEQEGKLPAGQGKVYAKNARNLGELGIGLNRKAGIVGNLLVDEKAYHTCHIAVGSNYDEDAPALIHCDGLIRNPTLTVFYKDGTSKNILVNGELR